MRFKRKESVYMEKDYTMYILVNEDIKISPGKLAGQVGHAVESYLIQLKDSNLINEHIKNSQKKIILRCGQAKLEELEKLGYITVRDNGLTELKPNTLTCVNFGIIDKKSKMPKFLKRLRLY